MRSCNCCRNGNQGKLDLPLEPSAKSSLLPSWHPLPRGEGETQGREGKLCWEGSGAHWFLSGGSWSPGKRWRVTVPILQLERVQGREQSWASVLIDPPGRMIPRAPQGWVWGPGQPLPACSDSALVLQGLFPGLALIYSQGSWIFIKV